MMCEFLQGRRRKVGCITLALAIVLVAVWLRSIAYRDVIFLQTGEQSYEILTSFGERLSWERIWDASPGIIRYSSFGWESEFDPNGRADPDDEWYGDISWRWRWIGFDFGQTVRIGPGYGWRVVNFSVPYWSVAFPLTLISAYLILRKPQKNPAEPENGDKP